MTGEPPFKSADKSKAVNFWRRATQCAASMHDALERGHWESAAINAVHCAISSNDAVLVALRGIKPTGADHKDAVRVLASQLKEPDSQKAAKRLGIIISKKSRVEYDQKRTTEKEARDLVLDAQRFYEWADSRLPERITSQ